MNRTRPPCCPLKNLNLCILLASFIIGTTHSLFVRPPVQTQPYPQLELHIAHSLGVPYQGIAYDAGTAASLPGFALSLNAEFGPLPDERTFVALQKAYGSWSETKSRVKWWPGWNYTLLDFLPPLLQAVSGLHFYSCRTQRNELPSFLGGPQDQVRKYKEQDVLLTSNCWGFAWEVLFQADNAGTSAMTISTADPTSAWRAFTGPGFDLVQSSRTQPLLLTDRQRRNQKTQPGDVLLIWHQNPSTVSGEDLYLDHVATLIDEDVYFEKSGSGDRVPFRVNTWDGLVANFPPSVFFWEWRRLVRNNPLSTTLYGSAQTRVQPAQSLFGVDSQWLRQQPRLAPLLSKLQPAVAQSLSLQAEGGDVIESQTYTGILVLEDLVFDRVTGRASLPKSAFQAEFYRDSLRSLLRNPYRK